MTSVGITGATGRMGRTVLEIAGERDDVSVAFAVNRDPEADEAAGVPVRPASEFAALLEEHDPDAVVDFTGPESTVRYARDCAAAGVAFVTGSTGFEDDQLEALDATGADVPVLRAANFARGVQVLRQVLGEAVAALPGYDIELTETHHSGKRDAPSGTAKTLLSDIAEVRDIEPVYGREGIHPRDPEEVGVHVRRAGDARGEHEVVLAGNDEAVTLSHSASDRGVFAAGALDAAVWLAGREPGRYDFGDVIGEA